MKKRQDWPDEKLFKRLAENKTDRYYWENIRVLRERATVDIFKYCLKLVASSKAKNRRIAVDILGQLGLTPRPFYLESQNIFFTLLETEKNAEVIAATLFAIGHNNAYLSVKKVKSIYPLKNHRSAEVRRGVVFALSGVNKPAAIAALIELSSDRIDDIRDWATFGIGTLLEVDSRNIREALWMRVNDKHEVTRLEAVVGLARRKDIRVKEIVLDFFSRSRFDSLLFEAAEQLQDKDLLPALTQQLVAVKMQKNAEPVWLEDLKNCIATLRSL